MKTGFYWSKLLVGLAAVVAMFAGGARLANLSAQSPDLNTGGRTTQTFGEQAIGDYWAVQKADGTIVRCRGCISGALLGTGAYQVLFTDDVRRCAYVATIGDWDASGTEPTGEITVVGRATDLRGVFLTTHNSAGALSNRSHHLFVRCDRTAG